MLNSVFIKNVAIIPEATIVLGQGLNVLSGETGAGKSIIVDSLNFVLGSKTDKSMIRHGEKSAIVEAVFDYNPLCEDTFNEYNIEIDEKIIISRTVTIEGKSDIKVNGRSVTLTSLKKITSFLVDIHGQHEHQTILKQSSHLGIIDAMSGEIEKAINDFSLFYKTYRALISELKALGGSDVEREKTLDFLQYQIEEIEKSKLTLDEEEDLRIKRTKILNTAKVVSAVEAALSVLNSQGVSVTDNVYLAENYMSSIAEKEEQGWALSERLKSIRIELDDITDTAYDLLKGYEFDEREADEIEDRLNIYKSLARKYGGTTAAVFEYLEKCKKEFDKLYNNTAYIEDLKKKILSLEDELFLRAKSLSEKRRSEAALLRRKLIDTLKNLSINAEIEIPFNDFTRDNFLETISSSGADIAEFYFSANKGEPLKPLVKIISGGEMSRFMLALKTIYADADSVPTMVFDEIDTGISGKVGQEVAKLLGAISRNHQVICITHLPQIASMADNHYLIEKNEIGAKTITEVKLLGEESELEEIARLSGGKDVSNLSISHAKEMKDWSNSFKKSLVYTSEGR